MRNKIILLLVFTSTSYFSVSQSIDSTFRKAYTLLYTNPDSAIALIGRLDRKAGTFQAHKKQRYYSQAANFYSTIGDFKNEAINWSNLIQMLPANSDTLHSAMYRHGMAELNNGKFTEAKADFSACEKYYLKKNNSNGLVKAYSGMGAVLTTTGNGNASIDYYNKAIRILKTTGNDLELAKMYSNLSIPYTTIGDTEKALEMRQKAYKHALLSGNDEEIHFNELNLGGSYNATDQPDSAKYYLKKAEIYFEKNFNAQILNAIYNELGAVFSKAGEHSSAETYYLKSINLLKSGGFDFALPGTLGNYGLVLHNLGKYKEGIQVCREALPIAKQMNYTEVEMVVCNCLYQNFKSANIPDSALQYYERSILLKDSIANIELQKTALRKELEAKHSEETQGIISDAEKEINAVTGLKNIFITGSILLMILLFFLLYLFRQKRKNVAYIEREKNYLDNLMHNLVHEFRTPLTLIKGPAEELIKADPNNTLLQLIEKNSRRMLDLVNQVLDFSKIKAGKLPVSEEVTDISIFTTDLIDLFTPIAEKKNIRLSYDNQVKHTLVLIDNDKLFKVLSNLISNALKYSDEGASVSVKSSLENDKLCFTVEDTGVGIPPEEMQNIFKKFYQIDATTTRKVEGTGLGLAFVDELVKLMKGTIEVKSEINKGTIVSLTFPYVKISGEYQRPAQTKLSSESTPLPQERTETDEQVKVLVIEDNVDLQTYLSILLKGENYEIFISNDGEEGINRALEVIPDLIISDVMMPKKDGLEVLNTLKNHPATEHIPILMLTAKASFDSMISGLETGADDYIAKPFKSSELLLRVRNHILQQRKLQQKYLSDTGSESTPDPKHPLLLQIEKLVSEESGAQITVEELAASCAMSRSQLHRKIKYLTGISTSALLTRIRLEHSKNDLITAELTISEIAYKYGYSDPANYSKLFKKQFGKSPSDYRNGPR